MTDIKLASEFGYSENFVGAGDLPIRFVGHGVGKALSVSKTRTWSSKGLQQLTVFDENIIVVIWNTAGWRFVLDIRSIAGFMTTCMQTQKGNRVTATPFLC